MPPAKKRPRAYDPAKTRAAVLAQFENVRAAVAALPPERLAGPTRLGEWSVRELAVHLTMVLDHVSRNLELPAPALPKPDVALLEWPFATAGKAGPIAADTVALAAELPESPGLDGWFAEVAERFRARVSEAPDDRLLSTRVGAMRLGDFLVTRAVELVVHTDDLNDATGLDIPYDRQALAICTRLLADALAEKAPGGSVEVRVPPFAVVQCVAGPKHTRGTPPNIVETDPLTWLRLATGRTEWARELAAAKVGASGERADLAQLLPLLR
ncbi:sterol carrier family protein [Streptomyces sp. DT171]|uniref:maleylpyruvate isomerase family mycothiol-dependent enzyme n=1 Tax=Streptomyces sp. DT171 TaxID=3416524 RepID=UPI003CF67E88